jgi:hypothetical protein
MNELVIHRWRSSYHCAAPPPPGLLEEWDDGLRRLDLDAGLGALADAGELVFIRTLRLSTRLGQERDAAQAADTWREALLRALRAQLAGADGGDVVRYRCRRTALCDMLYRACSGDASHDWVWVQMGLLRGGAHDGAAVLRAAVRELEREPATIWPALARLVAADALTGSLSVLLSEPAGPALDRLLDACPQAAPYRSASGAQPPDWPLALPDNLLVRRLLAWAAAHPAQASRRQAALAVLLAAAACPAHRDDQPAAAAYAAALLAECSRVLARAAGAAMRAAAAAPRAMPGPARSPSAREARTGAAPPRAAASAPQAPPEAASSRHPQAAADPPPVPELADAVERLPSDWAGLPFLLHLVPATGLPRQLDPAALAPLLWRVATAGLGVPSTDPAVRAFCGGWQPPAAALDHTGELALPAPLAEEADRGAAKLRERLAQRLPGSEPLALCRRAGMIHFEPGWIELRFPLRSAQAAVRRAALDLDPGWLPWLGCVVRFVYE